MGVSMLRLTEELDNVYDLRSLVGDPHPRWRPGMSFTSDVIAILH